MLKTFASQAFGVFDVVRSILFYESTYGDLLKQVVPIFYLYPTLNFSMLTELILVRKRYKHASCDILTGGFISGFLEKAQ